MQLLIETDILYDFLTHEASEPSVLRTALSQCTCYTTMLNAMELFRMAATDSEQTAVMNLLMVVRVLGFNSRYAEVFATMAKQIEDERKLVLSDREAMITGMAQASKLTILTKKYHDRYAQINVATVIASVGAGS